MNKCEIPFVCPRVPFIGKNRINLDEFDLEKSSTL